MSSRIRWSRRGNRAGACAILRNFPRGFRPLRAIAPAIWPGAGGRSRCRTILNPPRRKTEPENADLDSEVQAALSQLPELHRAAVTLRYFEELDYATIERTLGLSNGALRGILGRALGAMRRRLKPALTTIA